MSKPKLLEEAPADIRMQAYYYEFDRTGIGAIDLILSAVARAGKGYHHTEMWSYYDKDTGTPSYEQQIQDAADNAAIMIRRTFEQVKND